MTYATKIQQPQCRLPIDCDSQTIRSNVRRVKQSERRRAITEYGERRTSHRVPVETAIEVTPATLDGKYVIVPTCGGSIIAFTRNLSCRGVGFTHDDPLLTRHAIVSFDLIDGQPASFLIRIVWTRFDSEFPDIEAYVSGGNFLAVPEIPNP